MSFIKEKLEWLKEKFHIVKNKIKDIDKKVNEKIYFTFEKRLIIKVSFVVVSFLLFVFLTIGSLKLSVSSNIRYRQTSNLDYNVELKPNNFYEQKVLGKNMKYIAKLIDKVNVNFNYNFNTSDNLNYKYIYYIDGEIQVLSEDGGSVILSKKEKLKREQSASKVNSNSFNINEKLVIDYDKYNNIIKNFKSEYAISASSRLVVTLYVKVTDEEGNVLKKVDANNTMSITIPLTEQMIDIKMNYKELNNSDSFVAKTDLSIQNKVLFTFGIIFGIGFLISLALLIKFIGKLSRKKTAYDKTLAKILREYDRIIVESRKPIIIDSAQNIIDVKSFNELLDARDNLEKPIIFNEIHKKQKCIFVVKNSYEVYRYILKLVDLEKEGK